MKITNLFNVNLVVALTMTLFGCGCSTDSKPETSQRQMERKTTPESGITRLKHGSEPDELTSQRQTELNATPISGITRFDYGNDPGELWTTTTKVKGENLGITSIGNPKSDKAGGFTSYGGTQTFHFRSSTGEEYACPGKLWVGLSKGSDGKYTGSLDWGFVIGKSTAHPDWVESIAKEARGRSQQNIFLGEVSDVIGSDNRVFLAGPMRDNQGRLNPAMP